MLQIIALTSSSCLKLDLLRSGGFSASKLPIAVLMKEQRDALSEADKHIDIATRKCREQYPKAKELALKFSSSSHDNIFPTIEQVINP